MRIEPLDDAEYLLLTTTKRDGTPVPTPVWFQGANGRYVVVTGATSGKVKRIRNNPRVEVAVCDSRGNILPGAAILAATARVLEGADADAAADRVKKKYGIKWKAFMAGQGAWRKIRKTEPEPEAVVEVTLTEAI
ncbi:MAG: PPOX class F420-dependent oxidoreductase [Acidimicrobiales bacterium]